MIVNLLSCNVAYLLSDSFFNNSIYSRKTQIYILIENKEILNIFQKYYDLG